MINKIERYLIRMAVLSLLLVVVAQGLMTADPIRFYMSWSERMEGQSLPAPVSAPKVDSASPNMDNVKSPDAVLKISPNNHAALPEAVILINGKARYNFSRDQVTIRLNAGDTVEIDARKYNYPVEFTIASASANLAFPVKGEVFTANQSIVMIGKIIVK